LWIWKTFPIFDFVEEDKKAPRVWRRGSVFPHKKKSPPVSPHKVPSFCAHNKSEMGNKISHSQQVTRTSF
jgi:hypothetical protein